MASYMDMVTVLMCLFIVLYAMSTVDQAKFEQLKLALATGFGQEASEGVDAASGVVVPAELIDADGTGFTAGNGEADLPSPLEALTPDEVRELAEAEVSDLEALRDRIAERLEAHHVADRVEFEIDERGLTVKIIGSRTFFSGNSADLQPDAVQVLDAVGPELAVATRDVSVEGNADPRFDPAPYASTWELAGDRATRVVRYLVERTGVAPDTIGGTTYGSARPASTGDSPSDIALNRRVDIVVLSAQPDSVRQAIPGVVDGDQAPSTPASVDADHGDDASGGH